LSLQLVQELIKEGARVFMRKGEKENKVMIISKLQEVKKTPEKNASGHGEVTVQYANTQATRVVSLQLY